MNQWESQIVRNLRTQYGEEVENVSDAEILAVFNDWNLSDKAGPFLTWLLEP